MPIIPAISAIQMNRTHLFQPEFLFFFGGSGNVLLVFFPVIFLFSISIVMVLRILLLFQYLQFREAYRVAWLVSSLFYRFRSAGIYNSFYTGTMFLLFPQNRFQSIRH